MEMHEDSLGKSTLLSPDEIAEALQFEQVVIEHGGVPALAYELAIRDEPPTTFEFNLNDLDPWTVKFALKRALGDVPWSEVPDTIPDEYLSALRVELEPRARRAYDCDVRLWKFDMEARVEALADAAFLQDTVPASVEALRGAYDRDPLGAHRPLSLEYLGLPAVACLDCSYFVQSGGGPLFGKWCATSSHRALHWEPPRSSLCYMTHEYSEEIAPRRFPEHGERFGLLTYPPVATIVRSLFTGKKHYDYALCDSCNALVGPDADQP
jgi:hypothetical protein